MAGGMNADADASREYDDVDEDMDEEPPDLIA
jgi:hypothetical protein